MTTNFTQKIENMQDDHFLCFACGKKAGGWFKGKNVAYETSECKACGDWTTGVELHSWKFGEDRFS